MKKILWPLVMLAALVMALPGCAPKGNSAGTYTDGLDYSGLYDTELPMADETPLIEADSVTGEWTNCANGKANKLNEVGLPDVMDQQQGEWYGFRADGTFYYIVYDSAREVKGYGIHEGQYTVKDNKIKLTMCKDTFIPSDIEQYDGNFYMRQSIPEKTMDFRFEVIEDERVLMLHSDLQGKECIYSQSR